MKTEITVKGKPHKNSYDAGYRKCGFCGSSNLLEISRAAVDDKDQYRTRSGKPRYTPSGKPRCYECDRPTLRNRPRNTKNASKAKHRMEITN